MLSDKKYEKIEKALGQETLGELNSLAPEQLKERIAQAEGAVKSAQDELELSPTYQRFKEDLKDLSSGMKEVKKRQRAIVQYSLHLLEEQGK